MMHPAPPLRRSLVASTVAIPALQGETRAAMWSLFKAYYADVARDKFEQDLSEKDHVIVLRDPEDNSVQGFSTLKVYDSEAMGRRFVAVFSGDTLVASSYWGQTALQRAFLWYILRVKARRPLASVYWFLISKGYRTYLLLSRNFPEYWPRFDAPTPPWQSAVIAQLAHSRYGEAWLPERGVLQFPECHGRLRESIAPIDERMLEEPDIRFFVEANPGYRRGDELCCIGRVELRLAITYFGKLARRALSLPGGRSPARLAAPASASPPARR